ncbi:hypothetical protein VNO78_30835 [Psophocarpus tetragonolobus]|uniref:PHD-type domain-containing protein n=1 Tax=Psophocarpus tetragonolobus TaxID=3891 RepID=A0AAN9X860_PSOTE
MLEICLLGDNKASIKKDKKESFFFYCFIFPISSPLSLISSNSHYLSLFLKLHYPIVALEMEAEDGSSNGDNGEWGGSGLRLDSEDGDGGRIQGGNDVVEGEEWGLKDGAVNNGVAVEGEEVEGLKKEAVDNGVEIEVGNGDVRGEEVWGLQHGAVNNGVTIEGGNGVVESEVVWGLKNGTVNSGLAVAGGNGVAEGEEVQDMKNETVNNEMAIDGGNGVADGKVCALKNGGINSGVAIADGNGVAEDKEVLSSKNEVIHNGVAIADGNGVAEDEEALRSKNEVIDYGVSIANGNGVAEGGEVEGSKNEAVNNEMVVAEENGVPEGQEDHCLKDRMVDNEVARSDGFGVGEGNFGAVECLRTYKRRKHVKLCSEFKVQENSRKHMEAASHLSVQVFSTLLQHIVFPLIFLQEAFKTDKDGQECSQQLECLQYKLQSEANGHENVVHNGFSSDSNGRDVTERCQHVFHDILASEKFSSLCNVLLENFQGMKPETIFDFSVINSRMKRQAYEQSPTLFLSDVQQVWQKFQDTGNQIVAIAKSLSNMSKASFCKQVGISTQSSFEDEKQVESLNHMKPEQTVECNTYKVGTCRHCGEKADGTDCLVCDSCEEMYHLSCIEPSVKEIPRKSWFCTNCTAGGIGCRHEKCVVCERLNFPKSLDDIVGEESFPPNEETLKELEENSNCTYDGIQVSTGERKPSNCKICNMVVDGQKMKICGHSYCPSKYYHVRCLSSKQLKSYGHCWYCPSCICQVCLTDKDDIKIVLCDGCDHAYHIYCMKPPRNSIPRGRWFCIKCDAGIQAIRQARKAYESNKGKIGQDDSKPTEDVNNKWNKKRGRESDKVGGMDMLINAANTLNSEEDINAIQIDSKKTLT